MEGCPKLSIQSPYADLLASCSPPPALPHLPFAAESWGTGHAQDGTAVFFFFFSFRLASEELDFQERKDLNRAILRVPCCVPTANGISAYKIRTKNTSCCHFRCRPEAKLEVSKLPRKPSNRHPRMAFLVHPWAPESLHGITRKLPLTRLSTFTLPRWSHDNLPIRG